MQPIAIPANLDGFIRIRWKRRKWARYTIEVVLSVSARRWILMQFIL